LRLQESQHLLAEDEALVAFDFDAKSYAWIITKGDAAWIDLPISADGLKAQVKALRSSLTFDVNKPFDAELAFKLFQETFGALTDKLKGRTRISVVTNGALTSLPLQVLITSDPHNVPLKDINWLVRSYAITALPSVASLKTLRSKSSSSSAQKTMVGFADPIFSRQQLDSEAALRSAIKLYESEQPDLALLADRLPRLPETANEIRTVAHSLNVDEEDLYIGLAASVTSVKNAKLDHYRIVYFATHALLPEETKKFAKVKAEPALVLTLPAKPTDVDNGLLSASEVAQLKLDSDWVVLSACNTAAGDEPGAEALSGLARAFFYAGARSLIVSNWEVDSESTVSLMTGLFDALKANPHLSHAEALRLSMLQMINNGSNPEWADPKYWAPFVVVGEPQKN
jgi:CHAT domain-containing protein